MVNKTDKLACRVCGKIQADSPWGEDGQCPTFDICDYCGVEFGYGDCSLKAIRAARERLLANGDKWKDPIEKLANWSLKKQLMQIPKEYR